MERTEEQIVTQAPILVILGGKEYPVKELNIRNARIWRAKVIKLISPVPQLVSTKIDTPEDFSKHLTEMLVAIPDQVIDVFFEYAKDLDREEIEDIATDKEMAQAFLEVIKVAFPLAESAPMVIARLYPKKGSR
ncbi:hypothetical protein ES703_49487 [subsurface metagenome]